MGDVVLPRVELQEPLRVAQVSFPAPPQLLS
jgi:hypothetical protein